jgi:hypothetical protein
MLSQVRRPGAMADQNAPTGFTARPTGGVAMKVEQWLRIGNLILLIGFFVCAFWQARHAPTEERVERAASVRRGEIDGAA